MSLTSRDIDERGRPVGKPAPAGAANGGEPPSRRGGIDWSLLLIKVGGWLAVAAFGALFWLVNGGFSVLGLEAGSKIFGPGGLLFWQVISSTKLPWRFAIPGMPETQPLFPWIGVIATSLIQVGIVWRKLQGKPIPIWVVVVGLFASGYDFVTTYFGFGTLQWVQWIGQLVQVPISAIFTFGLEVLVGYLLRRSR